MPLFKCGRPKPRRKSGPACARVSNQKSYCFFPQSFVEQQKSQSYTVSEVLSDKANRKALLISIGCMFFQQMSGINVVIFYMTEIFQSTGSNIEPDMCTIIVGLVQVYLVALAWTRCRDTWTRRFVRRIANKFNLRSRAIFTLYYIHILVFVVVVERNGEVTMIIEIIRIQNDVGGMLEGRGLLTVSF